MDTYFDSIKERLMNQGGEKQDALNGVEEMNSHRNTLLGAAEVFRAVCSEIVADMSDEHRSRFIAAENGFDDIVTDMVDAIEKRLDGYAEDYKEFK